MSAPAGSRVAARAWLAATLLLIAGLPSSACLRAPIGDDYESDGLGSSGWNDDDSTGLGFSETTQLDESSSSGSTGSEPACHPSYVPCLPIVDDLNCSDVDAMDAAPVMVVGSDDYDLDADHDGIGCEG